MEEPGQPPLNKKKKTKEGAAVAQKESINKQENKNEQQRNDGVSSQEVKSKSADKTSEKTDARFNRFKLFDKVIQKSLEKYVEIARYVLFIIVLRYYHYITFLCLMNFN